MIYFDNAATTKVYDELTELYARYQTDLYFNPSAPYSYANQVSVAVEKARKNIATLLGAQQSEILFASSGSECDNIAIFCSKKKKGNILTSKCEHPAVYNAICAMGEMGFEIRYAPLRSDGSVDPEMVYKMTDENTSFASFMHVNNETGAINDIKRIFEIIKSVNKDTLVHSDGVQALGKIPVNVKHLNVDLYTISSHKIHAPKGCGALYIKKGLYLKPFIYGGGQENNIRSSTENVGSIVCFAAAAEKIVKNFPQTIDTIKNCSELIKKEIHAIGGKVISGENCVPHIVYAAFEKLRGEVLVNALSKKDILIGTGSACSTHKKASRIAESIGLEPKLRDGVIRISLSEFNDIEECTVFAEELKKEISLLREYERK